MSCHVELQAVVERIAVGHIALAPVDMARREEYVGREDSHTTQREWWEVFPGKETGREAFLENIQRVECLSHNWAGETMEMQSKVLVAGGRKETPRQVVCQC